MKKMVLLIAALMSIAGAQLMADCKSCSMKHGASKEERKAHNEEMRENREKRAEERKRRKEARKKEKAHNRSKRATE